MPKTKVLIMFIVKFSIIIAELDLHQSVLQILWCDKWSGNCRHNATAMIEIC